MSTYLDKLRDPRWQKKRLETLQRDGFRCLECGDDKSPLHVHHMRYFKGIEPWDVPDGALATLCEKCHEDAHVNPLRPDYFLLMWYTSGGTWEDLEAFELEFISIERDWGLRFTRDEWKRLIWRFGEAIREVVTLRQEAAREAFQTLREVD